MLWQGKLGGKLDFSKLTPCNHFGAEEGNLFNFANLLISLDVIFKNC